ncbi:DNA oxidative demethylase AlkB [Neisseriaceae bacterium JH1-16]|nr:DNA oxidative demethylase AlkB [Neisseriaceae bacterium JH1-16]
MTADLFADQSRTWREELCAGAVVLRGFALADEAALLAAVQAVVAEAPLRQMVTPGGYLMSVAMSGCGDYGWVSDSSGYRYDPIDPERERPWPAMPALLRSLAEDAAASAGFAGFEPDACLINRYVPGARLSLHQDRDERDMSAPIVSVSLGLPAVFQFGGARRNSPTRRVPLAHGDVVVWGGPARLYYHGVLTLRDGEHPLLGAQRINLTFRKAM